jgi:hypothetical protein
MRHYRYFESSINGWAITYNGRFMFHVPTKSCAQKECRRANAIENKRILREVAQ